METTLQQELATPPDAQADGEGPIIPKDFRAIPEIAEALGYDYRFNTDTNQYEWKIGDQQWDPMGSGEQWRVWEGAMFHLLKQRVQVYFRVVKRVAADGEPELGPAIFSQAMFSEMVDAAMMLRPSNPFREYLASCEDSEDAPRLEEWLEPLGVDTHAPVSRWGQALCWMSAIQRIMEPGCLLRTFPVIVGPGGCGKSQIIRHMLPEEQQHMFSDSFRFSLQDGRRVEAIRGKVIVEIPEMDGAGEAAADDLKGWLTRRYDTWRLAYRRDEETHPRRCTLIGTANPGQPIIGTDPALASRFVFLEAYRGHPVEDYMARVRDALWAQAYERYKAGERFDRVPVGLVNEQRAAAVVHQSYNTEILESMALKLDELRGGRWDGSGWNLTEIAKLAGFASKDRNGADRCPRWAQPMVKDWLVTHGFRQTSAGGHRMEWRYMQPDLSPEPQAGGGQEVTPTEVDEPLPF